MAGRPANPSIIPVPTGYARPIAVALSMRNASKRQEMERQQRLKQRRRHAFDETPHEVAGAVPAGKAGALRGARRAAHMAHDGGRDLDATVALQAQAKPQIDIFHVAEEPFIEPARVPKCIGTNQAGGSARGEYIALRRERRQPPAVPAAPGNPDGQIAIAVAPSSRSRIAGIELSRAEHGGGRMPPGSPRPAVRASRGPALRSGLSRRARFLGRWPPCGVVAGGKADVSGPDD